MRRLVTWVVELNPIHCLGTLHTIWIWHIHFCSARFELSIRVLFAAPAGQNEMAPPYNS